MFRPFGGLVFMLIKIAGFFLIALLPARSKTARFVSPLRLRQLVSQDELEARGIDIKNYELRPMSECERSWLQRWLSGSWLGDFTVTAEGSFIIYIPDVLYWADSSAWKQFFYDLTVWHQAAKCQSLLAETQASKRQLVPRPRPRRSVLESA
jgi:hypothetical protein